jgi:hypothetical protein
MYVVAISRSSASSENLRTSSAQFHDFWPVRATLKNSFSAVS